MMIHFETGSTSVIWTVSLIWYLGNWCDHCGQREWITELCYRECYDSRQPLIILLCHVNTILFSGMITEMM